MAIQDKIKELRKEKGWSQKELAEKLDMHPVNMTKIEQGQNMPSVDTLIRLSQTFNISIDYLLSEEVIDKESSMLKDLELIEALAKIERMDDKTKNTVKEFLDAFILKNQIGDMLKKKESK